MRSDAVWVKENKPIVWAECNESLAVRELLQFYLWAELSPVYIAYPVFRRDNYKKAGRSPFPIAYEAAMWLIPRWGREEWTCLSKLELIALLGRVTRNEHYENFLQHEI